MQNLCAWDGYASVSLQRTLSKATVLEHRTNPTFQSSPEPGSETPCSFATFLQLLRMAGDQNASTRVQRSSLAFNMEIRKEVLKCNVSTPSAVSDLPSHSVSHAVGTDAEHVPDRLSL